MKYAVQTMNRSKKSEELVISFFVTARGTLLQRTPLGIFRALLNSMLRSFPGYLAQLSERHGDREKRFGNYQENRWQWSDGELEEFMAEVLTIGTKNQPLIIFVDALDECGAESAKRLLKFFQGLMRDGQEAKLMICFSSRHYPILGLITIPTISVEEQNDRDIRSVIQERLKEIQPKSKRQKIENNILL